jgi:hypothetical protein
MRDGAPMFIRTRDSHHRSLLKALSWRIAGSLDTFVLSFIFTRSLKLAGSIAITEMFTKLIEAPTDHPSWPVKLLDISEAGCVFQAGIGCSEARLTVARQRRQHCEQKSVGSGLTEALVSYEPDLLKAARWVLRRRVIVKFVLSIPLQFFRIIRTVDAAWVDFPHENISSRETSISKPRPTRLRLLPARHVPAHRGLRWSFR